MGLKKQKWKQKASKKRGNVRGADDSGKPEQMPADDEKLSNATDVMGMARGKEGSDER